MTQPNGSFLLLSLNHETVALEVRERYALDDSQLQALYARLYDLPAVTEVLLLSTCNRFELYTQLTGPAGAEQVMAALSAFYGVSADSLRSLLRERLGQEAIQHLIEVAAGLRSQITGEAEIFGQVKNAYLLCHRRGYAGKVINRVFQKCFQAAKLIRHATSVGEGQINIANVAVDLAGKIFGSLDDTAVLALGTGTIGEKSVKALRSRGVATFGIASRSPERAHIFAQAWGGSPHRSDELASYLHAYDIVIASSRSEQPLVTADVVKRCAARRGDRPLFLIDLGLPRNIEQRCERLDNVFLYNLDDLASIAEENLQERRSALSESQSIAAEKSAHIWQSLVKRGYVR